MNEKNYFETLYNIDVNDKVEKKQNLSYLSWAFAWAEVKKIHPTANYIIYEREGGINYFTDGKTCWVKTGVIINDIEHIEYLPVMDNRNKSIPVGNVTSFDVNKTIQRSLTKACARHGLGLYIYAGEDLPEELAEDQKLLTTEQLKRVVELGQQDKEKAKGVLAKLKVRDIKTMTRKQAQEFINALEVQNENN